MLHPGVPSVLAAGLPQVAIVHIGLVVGAAYRIGGQRAIRGTLTQSLAVLGHDARCAPRAVGLLARFCNDRERRFICASFASFVRYLEVSCKPVSSTIARRC